MNRLQRVAVLTDRVIEAVAKTAGNEWENGSEYLVEEAAKLGSDDSEMRDACDAARRAIEGFARRRPQQRNHMNKRRAK